MNKSFENINQHSQDISDLGSVLVGHSLFGPTTHGLDFSWPSHPTYTLLNHYHDSYYYPFIKVITFILQGCEHTKSPQTYEGRVEDVWRLIVVLYLRLKNSVSYTRYVHFIHIACVTSLRNASYLSRIMINDNDAFKGSWISSLFEVSS